MTPQQLMEERKQGRDRRSPGPGGESTASAAALSEPIHGERDVSESASPRIETSRWSRGIDWITLGWIAFLHAGALAAPFFFSFKAVGLAMVLYWLTGGIGICLGFHRLFSHMSFSAPKPVRWTIAWLGGLAGQGSVIHWVATHRKHHAHSDHVGDPHSPNDGRWWSHVLWLFPSMSRDSTRELHRRWAPDLVRDPVLRVLDATFIVWHFVLGAGLYALGAGLWDPWTGWSFVVYGIFVRLVCGLHATWFVNSATHLWGYRNYETRDQSRNLWWVALLTFGEGWHNNHHAHPRTAQCGHRWWEIDLTYYTIWIMEKLGLAYGVVRANERQQRQMRGGS